MSHTEYSAQFVQYSSVFLGLEEALDCHMFPVIAQNVSPPACPPSAGIVQNRWVVYIYVDGNNNAWHIGHRQIKYQPVTPSLSGSGTYSGGSPFTVRLRPEQFAQLQSLIQKALQDRTAHKVNREKGDSAIASGKKKSKIG